MGYKLVAAGVPQGSVLGSILFGLFISDLPKVLKYYERTKYADDTEIYLHAFSDKLDDAISLIEQDVQTVADWAVRNGLQLNERKTKAIILGSMQYIAPINLETTRRIKINGTPIEYISSAKNLGITITDTLNWQPHITSLLGKVYGALNTLRFHRNALSFRFRIQLVRTLVLPHFDYAALIYMDVDLTMGQELQIAHNACVRFVIGSIPFIPTAEITSHVTHSRLKLGWLSLACRTHLQLIAVFYDIQCRKEPERLFDKIKLPNQLPFTDPSTLTPFLLTSRL